ncbi:helix-turn-helix transcriptional regulator [Paracoccaceae bacterium GXU_MW_L88]
MSGGDFVAIPHYKVSAAAGAGVLNVSEAINEFHSVNRKWLTRRGLSPEMLSIISVRGDSMTPMLSEGDLILIDRAQTALVDGVAFVLNLGGDLLVKFVQRISDHEVNLLSANRFYPPRALDLQDETLGLEVVGRVIASMHEW